MGKDDFLPLEVPFSANEQCQVSRDTCTGSYQHGAVGVD